MKHGLYDIYEKIYFKSLEDREKIISRVHLNFTIYISMLAVIFYMLRMIDYTSEMSPLLLFYLFLTICLLFMSMSVLFAYKTLSGNYEYHYFTPSVNILNYRNELIQFYDNTMEYNATSNQILSLPDIELNLKNLTFEILGKCCDINNALNKGRMFSVRRSVSWLWSSVILFIIASAIFAIMDLDVSSPRKDTLVKDQSVASEISKLGQFFLSETRCFMSDSEFCKKSYKPGTMEKDTLPRTDAIQKPVMPKPPTSQIIRESYSLWQKKD